MRLILLAGQEEAPGVPGVPGRSQRSEGEAGRTARFEVRPKREDVGGGASAAVQQQHDGGGVRERDAGRCEGCVGVGVIQPHRLVSSPAATSRSGSKPAWILDRWPSSHGGSWSFEPSAATVSSVAKPGGSVAISKSTPPGSRK